MSAETQIGILAVDNERLRRRIAELEGHQDQLSDEVNEQGQAERFSDVLLDSPGRGQADEALLASEVPFRSVLENMSEGLMLFDPGLNLTYQNPASLRIHGFAADEDGRIGNDSLSVTWDAWDETGRSITFEEWPVSRVFRGERFQDQVLRVVRRETGFQFYGSYNGSPIRDAAGRLVMGFITIRDITEQVRARQAQQWSERRLRTFFHADLMGALSWSVEGAILDANDKFLRMVGYTREDLVAGRLDWARMSPGEYRALDEIALEELRTTGIDTPYEKEFIRKDGSRVPVFIGAVMLDESRHDGVAFVLDITERKRAETALREANDMLREADRRKDEFLAILAHELRNPLAPVRTGVQILRLGAAEGRAAPVLSMMERQLEHMARLLDDLLDVSRITQGKITLRLELFDLREAAHAAVEASRPMIDEMGHALFLALPAAPVPVKGDRVRLAQVFTNLLNNAARYTPKGGRIDVSGRVEAQRALFSVRDNGIGIRAEDRQSIFELFGQIGEQGARPGGLGIGLSLVRGLLGLHAGEITLASEGPEGGSEFCVVLPTLDSSALGDAAGDEDAQEAPRVRFLVVDDNRDAALSLTMLLGLMGHEVRTAHGGPEALDLAEAFRPAVVLLDLGMPQMDGFEVCRRLRGSAWGAQARIIAVSGWGQDEDRRRSKLAGFDAHLVKPVTPEDVIRVIRGDR